MKTRNKQLLPMIHLNGNSRESLEEQAYNAMVATQVVLEALRQAAPNARNFYPLGDMAISQAEREYRERIDALVQIHAYYEDMCRYAHDPEVYTEESPIEPT